MAKKTETAQKNKRLVLLDTHAILHRAFHALPDFASPKGEPTGALYGLVAMLLKLIEDINPDYIVACYDLPEPTHRHEAFDGYKAKREKTDDSLVAQIIRSRDIFTAFGIPMYDCPGFEADDVLGTLAERAKKVKGIEVVIASGDMDTLQLVDGSRVRVYTLRKGIKDTVMYDEKAVRERFGFGPLLIPDYKGLRGDPSDNIPGIKGVGEKTALTLMRTCNGLDDLYGHLTKGDEKFLELGITPRMIGLLRDNEEEAEFSKTLATIHRDVPILFTLPDTHWSKCVDVATLLSLFSEFGFRTLGARVQSALRKGGIVSGDAPLEEEVSENIISADELETTALALWVLESDMTNPKKEDILEYGKTEGKAHTFAESRAFILKRLAEENMEKVYTDIELPLRTVLHEMERYGILLDVPYLKTLSEKFHTELSGIESRLYEHAGVVFNINSPKQLADVLYDTLGLGSARQKRTATGQRSTKESELEKLREEHVIIPELLRYRELQKLVSTYVDNLPEMVGSDGRVHTTFLQAGSTTGRIATTRPSIQNIPIRTEEGKSIRRAFVAGKGMKLVSIDYSQIELRIAAFLSGDKKLMEIFMRGEDVHRGVASRVFAVSESEVTADMRRKAKVINFGILYGMGVNALRTNLGEGTSRAEAQEFLNAYFNTFTRLAEYLEETKQFARLHGYTETFFGRRRHFGGIRSSIPFIRTAAERMAINAPIQGTSADIIRIAMIRIGESQKIGAYAGKFAMMLSVHDELVFEIEENVVMPVVRELKKIMEGVLTRKDTHGVPITTEAAVGNNWGQLERVV